MVNNIRWSGEKGHNAWVNLNCLYIKAAFGFSSDRLDFFITNKDEYQMWKSTQHLHIICTFTDDNLQFTYFDTDNWAEGNVLNGPQHAHNIPKRKLPLNGKCLNSLYWQNITIETYFSDIVCEIFMTYLMPNSLIVITFKVINCAVVQLTFVCFKFSFQREFLFLHPNDCIFESINISP